MVGWLKGIMNANTPGSQWIRFVDLHLFFSGKTTYTKRKLGFGLDCFPGHASDSADRKAVPSNIYRVCLK